MTTNMLTPYEKKAHALIQNMCKQTYKAANTAKTGKSRKKHQPYSIPPMAEELIAALKLPEPEKEETLKSLFLQIAAVSELTRLKPY